MLLRTLLAVAGLSLLSACTIPLWGEDKPTENASANGGLPPQALQVPPDLTKPVTSASYNVSRNDAACPPPTTGSSTSAVPSSSRDIEERLLEAQTLRDKGLISDLELQQKRKALLENL